MKLLQKLLARHRRAETALLLDGDVSDGVDIAIEKALLSGKRPSEQAEELAHVREMLAKSRRIMKINQARIGTV